MTYRGCRCRAAHELAIEYLRNMQVPNSGMRDNKSLVITCDTLPRVERLIYVNTRSAARITTAQSEAFNWAASLSRVVVVAARAEKASEDQAA